MSHLGGGGDKEIIQLGRGRHEPCWTLHQCPGSATQGVHDGRCEEQVIGL